MLRILTIGILTLLVWNLQAQKRSKKSRSDSIKVVISLVVKDKKIETAKNFWESYFTLPVKLNMYGFKGGNRHLYRVFDMQYDPTLDAWQAIVPRGFFELRVESLGFKDIQFPLRLKTDFEEEFTLDVDSLSYTYKHRKRYNYIKGSLLFNETIIVDFNAGDYATNRAFLDEALAVEGLEYINVRRALKMPGRNAFIVTLDIWDTTPLKVILYKKVKDIARTRRGYQIGPHVTKAIELYQANPNVAYANPTFLDDEEQEFRNSANYTKSEKLERKLQTYMVQDEQTLKKINYIIKKTTPKKKEEKEEG